MADWQSKLRILSTRSRQKLADVRETALATLTRRRLMGAGLAAAGGALAVRQGVGRAAADETLNIVDGVAPSPISTPFSADMPQVQAARPGQPAALRVKVPVSALNPPP